MSRLPQSIRQQVRKRANERCEYCYKPDEYVSQSHHVDHIISLKHKGSDALDNLAWACFQCNLCKGTDIASIDEITKIITPLFHPRLQIWDEHFQLDGASILGNTAIGRVTVALLQINHPEQVETRQILIDGGLW